MNWLRDWTRFIFASLLRRIIPQSGRTFSDNMGLYAGFVYDRQTARVGWAEAQFISISNISWFKVLSICDVTCEIYREIYDVSSLICFEYLRGFVISL